jgi:hypothetical protein
MSNRTDKYRVLQIIDVSEPTSVQWQVAPQGEGEATNVNFICLVEYFDADGVEVREVAGMLYSDWQYIPVIPPNGYTDYTLVASAVIPEE